MGIFKPTPLAILLTLISFGAQAQREIEYKEEYPELLNLYMDEEYEEVIKKVEKGTLFSKAIMEEERNQPLPYIYLAKAYYEISKMEEYKEKYSRAFKNSIRYAGRFIDRDEKRMFIKDHERFLIKLRRECMEIAAMHLERSEYERGQLRKARYFYKKLQDLSPNDPSPHYMEGLTWIMQDLEAQADRPFKAADEKWKKLESISELKEDQQDLFKTYVEQYSRHLVEEGQKDSARSVLQKVNGHFQEDQDFRDYYQKVTQ